MCNTRCWDFDNINITMTEYYDFMPCDEEDGGSQSSSLATSEFGDAWGAIQVEVKPLEAKWLRCTLQDLNDKLKPLKAHCTVSEGSSSESPSCLTVEPQDGSEAMDNWDGGVKKIVDEVTSCFVEKYLPLPLSDSLRNEVVSYAQDATGPNLHLRCIDGKLVIGGHIKHVNLVELDLKHFMEEVQVVPEVKVYSTKHIKCLSSFSKDKLKIDGVTYTLDKDVGNICVRGKLRERQFFWDAVDNELIGIHEKRVDLSPETSKLLESERGTKKIEELIGVASTSVTYHLKCDVTHPYLYFLSPGHAGKDILKTLKGRLKGFLDSRTLAVNPGRLRLCRGMKWRKLVGRLEDEAFVSVTVDESSNSVIVSGETIVVGDAYEVVEIFFLENCSVEEQLIMGYHEWMVISSNFKQKTEAIQHDLVKVINIVWPKQDITRNAPVTIILRGDPIGIDNALVRLEALRKEVCHKEGNMSTIPSANQLVDSMQNDIYFLEVKHCVSINVSVVDDDSSPPSASALRTSSSHHKLCGASLSNGVRVSLYSGDFTKHGHVDTMVNFVQLSPENSDTNLMQLFATAGGSVVPDEFKSKLESMLMKDSGYVIKTSNVGQLKCSQLFHSLLCCWTGGKKNEGYFLELCLKNVLYEAKHLSTIVLASVCSKPLSYPAGVFAKKLISSLNSSSFLSSDLTVAVYVSDPSEAAEFDAHFQDPENVCHSIIPLSVSLLPPMVEKARVICNPIDSLITLQRGDLLKQKVL